jgi:hypothetical protein
MSTQNTIIAFVVLSIALGACGSSNSGSVTGQRRAVRESSANAIPPLRFVGGDYDNDDYDAHGNDADNDDSHGPKDRDNDIDSSGHGFYDRDDREVRDSGRPASATERRQVGVLVARYYAAAAAGDGLRGCSLISPTLARSVPQTLGHLPGPPYLHGTSCAEVMTKLYRQNHAQLTIFATTLKIVDVRVSGDQATVVLGFGTRPARDIGVVRTGDSWKMAALLDYEMP